MILFQQLLAAFWIPPLSTSYLLPHPSSNVKYALLLQNCQSQTQSRVVSPFSSRSFSSAESLSGKLDETLFRSCPAGKSRKEAAGNPYWIPLTSRVTSNSTRPSLGSYKVFYPDFLTHTPPSGHLLRHTPMYYVILILHRHLVNAR